MGGGAELPNVRKGTLIMTVGLPGVGLGGIFYLVSAIFMPVREAVRLGRGTDARRAAIVVRQGAMAATILAAMWVTGWMLGHLIAHDARSSPGVARALTPGAASNVLQVSALVLSLGMLTLVLATVHGARLVVRLQQARARKQRALAAPSLVPTTEGLRVDSGTFGRGR
jgi:hypothetical protein